MATVIAPNVGDGLLYWQQDIDGGDPGYAAIDDRRASLLGLQEGVLEAGNYAVTQNSGGVDMSVDIAADGGFALVEGDSVAFQGLYVVPPHSASINEAISAAHGSLPRVDRVVLEAQDDTWDASGENGARTLVLDGTPTSGAKLDNLNGAAAVDDNQLLLADVLVPAADTTISNSQIRDRRKWARGAYVQVVGSGAGNHTATGAPTTTLSAYTRRIECSGAPLRIYLSGRAFNTSAGGTAIPQIQVDGTTVGWAVITSPAASEEDNFLIACLVSPTAGSHLITIGLAPGGGVGTATLVNSPALSAPALTIEEVVRQDTANDATSG